MVLYLFVVGWLLGVVVDSLGCLCVFEFFFSYYSYIEVVFFVYGFSFFFWLFFDV